VLELTISQALYGISYGLLLFMLAAGLTLIFSMMGVLNFAHASFYMLGAYLAYQFSTWTNFWVALVAAPLAVVRDRVRSRALGPAARAPLGPRARTAVHLRPVVHHRRTGAGDLGPAAVPYRVPAELDGPVLWLQVTASRSRSTGCS
jgi:branched-chain amino acid transport system permease protein